MCKCVQLPASAQRGTKKNSDDGVVVERGKVGVRERGGYFYIRRWERVAGQEPHAKELPLSIQPDRASLATQHYLPLRHQRHSFFYSLLLCSKASKFYIIVSNSPLNSERKTS